MKKSISTLLFVSLFMLFLQGCDTQGNLAAPSPLAMMQQLLTSGSDHGFSILGNAQAFATNALVEAALPDELKSINSKLESLGLTSIVDKEKAYIGKAATQAAIVAQPIVTKAIQQMTMEDAIAIATGGKGAATKFLKDKTEAQLIAAIQPKVEAQLNSNGATSMLNSALKGSNIMGALSSLFGSNTTAQAPTSISGYASKQMVDGLFNVVEDYENQARSNPSNLLGAFLK